MLQVTVCVGSSCYLKGSWQVVKALQAAIAEYRLGPLVELKAGFCHSQCQQGVVVVVGDKTITGVRPEDAVDKVFLAQIWPEVKGSAGTAHQASQL